MKKLILIVPVIIIFFIVAAVTLLLFKLWIWGIVLLAFALILNWWSETFALHPFREKHKDYDFRLLTYNINRAHEISENKGSTEELIDFILAQNADVVLLQEYNAELYPLVQEKLSREYLYGSGVDTISRFKSVFSRFPIESCEQLMVDSNSFEYEVFKNWLYCKKQHNGMEVLPICKMMIQVGNHRLQLFNCHLMSNNYSVVIRNLRKKEGNIIHGLYPILHRIDFGYKARKQQIKIIKEKIELESPTIVCGDFNDVGGSPSMRRFQKVGIADAWWKGGFGLGFTFHGMGLRFRLDHVLFSKKHLRLRNVFIPDSNVSDHNPLVCDFKFK